MNHSSAPAIRGQRLMYLLACSLLGVTAPGEASPTTRTGSPMFALRITFNEVTDTAELVWSHPENGPVFAIGRVRALGANQLAWELECQGEREPAVTSGNRNSIHATLGAWLQRLPTNLTGVSAFWVVPQPGWARPVIQAEEPFGSDESAYAWIENNLAAMARHGRALSSPLGRMISEAAADSLIDLDLARHQRRLLRKEQKQAEQQARAAAAIARLAQERRFREEKHAEERRKAQLRKAAESGVAAKPQSSGAVPAKERPALPPVPVQVVLPPLSFQETAFTLTDLKAYQLREHAALWWVSNQSDDLLCLPHCRIKQLDYQLRTALRVLGPLRGRALLSDEVGLGKTIEAGLVIKELLTRGMVKRFLVLTVPSLVDQWEEELSDKFGLTTVTTNHDAVRGNGQAFWRLNEGIVASLHTLKQPAHLEIARRLTPPPLETPAARSSLAVL